MAVVARIFRVGVDFGFYHDPTALVVVEPRLDPERVDANGYPLVRFEVRFTERVPLGTTAQGIVSRITEIVDKLEARALRPQIEVFVDATGTGVAVKDLLAPELQRQGTHLFSIVITAGHTERYEHGTLYVPKEALIQRLAVLLEQGRVLIPKEEEFLRKELESFQVKISEATRRPKYEAPSGEHDDLVIALALAVYKDVPWEVLVSKPVRPRWGL